MKKIAVLYLGRKGAGPVYSLEMIKALAPSNIQILCVLSNRIENKKDWETLALNHHNVKLEFVETYTNKLELLKSWIFKDRYKNSFEEIQTFAPDFFYIPMFSINAYLYVKKFKNVPVIMTVHDLTSHLGEKNFLIDSISNYIIKHSKYLIVLSKKFIPLAQKRFNFKKEDIFYIPHANFSYYNKENKIPSFDEIFNRILFFGRINKYKGLSVLLRAMPLIWEKLPSLKLRIAGNGEISENEINFINENKDKIELINGWIKDEDVWDYFKDIDMTIVPYIEASQSGVIPLSYSAGKSAIATNVGGLDEQIIPIGGVVVETNNPEAIANAVIEKYSHPEVIISLNKKAFDFANQYLTWDKSAQSLLSILLK